MALTLTLTGQTVSPTLQQINVAADAASIYPTTQRGPLVGVTAETDDDYSATSAAYYDAIRRAGGIPVIIPVDTTTAYLNQVIGQLDGLLLVGGVDVNPVYYGEKPHKKLGSVDGLRDVNELKLIRMAVNRNIPIMGVCRGCQILNVAMGGTLIQDIPSQVEDHSLNHRGSFGNVREHSVGIENGSLLHKILGKDSLEVNSSHHQAVKDPAPGAHIDARASDGVIEAYDYYPLRRIIGVQWHPEGFWGTDADMNKIYEFFVGQADLYRQAKQLHSQMLTFDSHTDAPLHFVNGRAMLGTRCKNRVNLPKMQEGMLDSQVLAAFVPSYDDVMKNGEYVEVFRALCDTTYQPAWKRTLQLIDITRSEVEKNSDLCGIALNDKDVARLKAQGKKAIFLAVENGLGIGTDINRVKMLADMGIKYITLTHSWDNQICRSSSKSEDSSKGLTDFGKKVVKEMNRHGIIIDLSHCSEGTFWDVMKVSKKPVVCTHSGARALCDHDRNLTDSQLKALAANGGVVQTVAYRWFLAKDGNATIDDFVKHLDYMVKVAGIDHVGIGSDFDGGAGIPGLDGDNDMINITMRLLEMGYTKEDIAKIWGGNFFRVMNAQ